MVSVNQHVFMPMFEANFSTRYLILFSGSRDGHNIYKWVPTQRSLGTNGLENDISKHFKNIEQEQIRGPRTECSNNITRLPGLLSLFVHFLPI